MKISKIENPSKGKIKSYFIAGDWHTEAIHWASFEIMCKMARKKPKKERRLIINGDFLDAPHLMARSPQFKKWIKRSDGIDEFFIPVSEKEIQWGNDTLDAIQSVFSEVIYVEGNHDWRYRDFMAKVSPDFAHNFDYRRLLRLEERGIQYCNYNDWIDIGDHLSITHGMYHGSTCHKKHYEASGGKSVIFSHVHYEGAVSFHVRGETRTSWSLPAFCELNPEYIKNRETNWTNGFGEIHLRDDGNFNFYTHRVINRMCVSPSGVFLQ